MEAGGGRNSYGRNSIYSAPFLPATVWQCGLLPDLTGFFFFFKDKFKV